MLSPWFRAGVPATLLVFSLLTPAHTHAQERGSREASAVGATLGGITGFVVGVELAEAAGSSGCHDICTNTVVALSVEALFVALGATTGNGGRGSFLADAVVSGLGAVLFADAAGREQYDVAAIALVGQLFGVITTEMLTSPRAPVAVSVLPSARGLEVGLAFRPGR